MFRVIHVCEQPMVSERFQIQLPACNWGLLPIPSNLEGWNIFSMVLVANMTLPKGRPSIRFSSLIKFSDLSNSARPLTRPESNRAKSSNTCEAIQETIEANIDWWTVDKEKHGRSGHELSLKSKLPQKMSVAKLVTQLPNQLLNNFTLMQLVPHLLMGSLRLQGSLDSWMVMAIDGRYEGDLTHLDSRWL